MLSKLILIIDDEENFCKLVKKNLEQNGGFQVAMATNAEDGIETAKRLKPDLILLDIIMPGMDGGEAMSIIEQSEGIKNIPVVFLSAMVTKADVSSSKGVMSGYPVFSKTATADELIACIEKNIKK